jgi:bifunctional non-homologous end joining protein LigD
MPRTLPVRRQMSIPRHIKPMLASPAEGLPSDLSRYNFEWKWDGVRALCYWDGRFRLDSRNLLDITTSYPELRTFGRALGVQSAILDGEIVAFDDDGRPSFSRLQRRMHVHDRERAAVLSKTHPAWYVLFDILHLNGRSLLDEPYSSRREILESLTIAGPSWQITAAHVGEGPAMLKAATESKLEGIVAKRLDAPYTPGRRSPDWLKIKTVQRQEFVIGGWVPERSGSAGRVGALLMGYYDEAGQFRYAGKVGTGLSGSDHPLILKRLAGLARSENPFADRGVPRDAKFVAPSAVAEIEYRRWPEGGMVQQASYQGLRDDKPARRVVRENVEEKLGCLTGR